MRIELDEAYMQMAEVWANRSYATRAKVGALLVKDKQIISDGYNGMPSGFPNEEIEFYADMRDAGTLTSNPLVLHAEANAILKCAKNGGVSSDGATLYVTMSPCRDCCKLIIQSGIKRVVYRNQYRDISSLDVFKRTDIKVEQLMTPPPGLKPITDPAEAKRLAIKAGIIRPDGTLTENYGGEPNQS